jgi:hypothetical protein
LSHTIRKKNSAKIFLGRIANNDGSPEQEVMTQLEETKNALRKSQADTEALVAKEREKREEERKEFEDHKKTSQTEKDKAVR